MYIHQSSKSYITALIMCLKCRWTSPSIRTQPFYLPDVSKLNQTKADFLYIHPGALITTVLGSLFQKRSWFLVLVQFLGSWFWYCSWFLVPVPCLILGSSTFPGSRFQYCSRSISKLY